MAKVLPTQPMEINMIVNGNKTNGMAKVMPFLPMEINIMVN